MHTMFLTHKRIQYTVRAIVELAKYYGQGPRKISEIAEAQFIPLKFLEVILNQMKGSGWVTSKRGFYGGYTLTRNPAEITVGDIVRYMQGGGETTDSSDCFVCESRDQCPFSGECVFSAMWNRVTEAAFAIYDETSIQDLLESHLTKLGQIQRGLGSVT